MNILKVLWATGGVGCIGIVVTEDRITGVRKARIDASPGISEEEDAQSVAANGGQIMLEDLKIVVALLEAGK